MSTYPAVTHLEDITAVSVALIVPDAVHRQVLARLFAGLNVPVREYVQYPRPESLDELIGAGTDVFVIDLDASPEQGLSLIENICARTSSGTVMAYSSSAESDLLMRSMQAGAREFLGGPLLPSAISEALGRALARREKSRRQKTIGKVCVFTGAKGGAGTTMIATNFAIALSEENVGKVVVVDLDLRFGEVALALGLTPKFSILDALQNVDRLDSVFVLSLLVKHTSGLWVLSAPEQYTSFDNIPGAVSSLVRILREEFAYVVVDAGPSCGAVEAALFDLADTVYLVTEISIPALRNARRLLGFIAGQDHNAHQEVVLNRFNAREVDIDENSVVKALARPLDWRIPNEFSAVRSAENAGIPLAMKNSAITKVLRQMAKTACGKGAPQEKKASLLGLFQ